MRAVGLACALGGWGVLVVTGLYRMAAYASTPGSAGLTPRTWPKTTSIEPAQDAPTLLMFLHPRCPCSGASVGALRALLLENPRAVARIVIYVPERPDPEWTDTELWNEARALPNVTTLADAAGAEAMRFGATTSGEVLVYDRNGSLQFEGGITPGRGEEGDCLGRRAAGDALAQRPVPHASAPVFGCALFEIGSSAAGAREGPP